MVNHWDCLENSFLYRRVIYLCFLTKNNCYISGLDRFEARKKLWSDLEETSLAVKKEPYTLRVPRSQRGGEVSLGFLLHAFASFDYLMCMGSSFSF